MHIDFVTLKLFIAACEETSIARAAEREGIAASALSKRLSDLEASLKVVLFHRNRKGLEPTASAQTLLRHARVVMSDLTQMVAEVGEHRHGLRGTVRIHSNVWAILQYLPNDLASFMALHPLVRVEVEESISPATIKAVEESLTDIGIIGSNLPAPGLGVAHYRTDRLVAVVPRGHALSHRGSLRIADMVPYQLIGSKQGSSLDDLVQHAMAQLDQPPKLRIRVTGFEAACRMVEANLGLALVPRWCADQYALEMNVVPLTLDEPWAERSLNLCFAANSRRSPLIDVLVEHLRAPPRRAIAVGDGKLANDGDSFVN
jgi:DNA-binding transcriptional LysR family regulator